MARIEFLPTSEQVNLMRQQIPLQGVRKVAEKMAISPDIVRRWQKQEGIPASKRRQQKITS